MTPIQAILREFRNEILNQPRAQDDDEVGYSNKIMSRALFLPLQTVGQILINSTNISEDERGIIVDEVNALISNKYPDFKPKIVSLCKDIIAVHGPKEAETQ